MKKMKAFFKRCGIGLLIDITAAAGAVLLSIGAGQIYAPAGLIVGGVCCIAAAVVIARGESAGGDGS